jgi:hypothetical protein
MAPELHKKNASECDLFKADIWSLGITFYTYAYLKLPFHGNCL